MKILLAALTTVLFFTACEFQQDPTEGAPEAVRNGRIPDQNKPVAEKSLPADALQIDGPNDVFGRVGTPVEFKIQGRVMVEGVNFTLSIENLSEFPGATYDAQTGEFKWTPTKEIVSGFSETDVFLKVRLVTVRTEKVASSLREASFRINVKNTYTRPIVNFITAEKNYVTGSNYDMAFELEDIDATGDGDVNLSVRDCASSYSYKSISHFVKIQRYTRDANRPGKFVGTLSLQLSNAALVPSDSYCFALQATSKFNVASELYTKQFNIQSKIRDTRANLEEVEMLLGQTMSLSFSIYDPSGYGTVSVKSMTDISTLLPGSSLSCRRAVGNISQLDCTGVLNAVGVAVKNYDVEIVVLNTLQPSLTVPAQTKPTTHKLRIKVKAVAL